jgi:hypothetical protein
LIATAISQARSPDRLRWKGELSMKPTNTEIFHKVKQWINFGDEDLRLARHALKILSSCPTRLIAYHAQQCAEKYLKAYLVFHRIYFPS